MQYIVVVKHHAGTVHYGPFHSRLAAESWANDNWMNYEIHTLNNV